MQISAATVTGEVKRSKNFVEIGMAKIRMQPKQTKDTHTHATRR